MAWLATSDPQFCMGKDYILAPPSLPSVVSVPVFGVVVKLKIQDNVPTVP